MEKEKIKVCFFVGTHGDWGGASRIIFNIIRRIDRSRFHPIVVLTAEGPICAELRSSGVAYEIRPLNIYRNIIQHMAHVIKCILFYRSHGIELVVLAYGCLGWRPAELMAARVLNIPVVQHCQRIIREPSPYTRYSSQIFTSTKYIHEQSGFTEIEVGPLYDLVNVERFASGKDIRDELGIPPSNQVVTFLGRRRKRKGLELFIDLARRLENPTLSFIVATQRTGKPNDDTYSDEDFANMIKSDARIMHVAYRDDVENIYATSDVIVMPSVEPEPCPAVAIEAAASGRPIVATDTGATNELVVDGETGLLVTANDLDALVGAVETLLADVGLRSELGRKSMDFARRKFVSQPVEIVNLAYSRIARG